MKNNLVRLGLFSLGLLLALACLHGCLINLGETLPGPGNQLSVAVNPSSGYPPLNVTLTFSGVSQGQYTVIVGGHTYTQGSNIKQVILHDLPCEGEVIWERPGYATQRAQFYVALDNEGPVIGRLRLNGLDDLWYLHPRTRYIVDFPEAYDPEGGSVILVDAHVKVARKQEEDTVFCPPYVGATPPIPDVYHAFDRNHRMIENAFVFHCTWTGPIDGPGVQTPSLHLGGYTNLPFSPPGYGESGYPGQGTNCPIGWSTDRAPATTTTITATFRDEDEAETTEHWLIKTGPDPGCNIY